MKRIILFLVVTTCFYSCQKEFPLIDDTDYCDITFSFEGEIAVDYTPLTKGSIINKGKTTCPYGINLFQDGKVYNFGIYTDISNLKLHLPKGHSYRLECTAIKGMENIFNGWYTGRLSTHGVMLEFPFDAENKYQGEKHIVFGCKEEKKDIDELWFENNINCQINRLYFYEDGYDAYQETTSRAESITSLTYINKGNNVESCRYYAAVDFIADADTSVIVNMKHAGFGLQYQVEGLTDGSIKLKINGAAKELISETVYSNKTGEQKVYALKDLTKESEIGKVAVIWERGNGITEDLGSADVILKRNMNNLIKVKLGAIDKEAGVSITTTETKLSGNLEDEIKIK